MTAEQRVRAVVTTYRPDAGFVSRFRPLLANCEHIYVVDNTPGGFSFGQLPPGFSVIQDGTNRGLGCALNRGVLRTKQAGADYVILFDQDSTPTADAVAQLLAACRSAQDRLGERCAVGPTHADDARGCPIQTTPPISSSPATHEVTCLPTSGLLFPLRTIDSKTLFASDLFLDLVDFEWCWRQRRAGWHFLRAREIPLLHRLGIEERRCLGLRFHVPAPYRHYFQFRDSLRLASRRYVPVYSRIRLTGLLPIKLLIYPFILDRGVERLRWMIRGIVDAVLGVTGIGAASDALAR